VEAFRLFVTELLVATQSRGADATGFAGYYGAKKMTVGKGPIPAIHFVRTPAWNIALRARSAILHCRLATHGSPGKNENNHPFQSGRSGALGPLALVHNGVVRGYRALASREGVKLASECDSEVILRVIERHAGKSVDTPEGMRGFYRAVQGAGADYAIAVLDRRDGSIRLLRDDGRPCSILRLPRLGIVVFGSTVEILRDAIDATAAQYGDEILDDAQRWICEPDKVYILRPTSLEVDHELMPALPSRKPTEYPPFEPWSSSIQKENSHDQN
jgi:glutamine phosphoribosylpyrophosphate amidotransferase